MGRTARSFSFLIVVGLAACGGGGGDSPSGGAPPPPPPGSISVGFAWDVNTEPDLAGYRIHYGTAPGNYSTTVDVGNTTTYTVNGLASGMRYYFAITAYDTSGNESGFSQEISRQL